jgi:hypothetical protein
MNIVLEHLLMKKPEQAYLNGKTENKAIQVYGKSCLGWRCAKKISLYQFEELVRKENSARTEGSWKQDHPSKTL